MTVEDILHAEAVVYRIYDGDETLLYVGASEALVLRLDQHRQTARWWYEAVFITAERFRDRARALKAELQAIDQEAPRYNVTGSRGRVKPSFPPIEEPDPVEVQARLEERQRREWARRFDGPDPWTIP